MENDIWAIARRTRHISKTIDRDVSTIWSLFVIAMRTTFDIHGGLIILAGVAACRLGMTCLIVDELPE